MGLFSSIKKAAKAVVHAVETVADAVEQNAEAAVGAVAGPAKEALNTVKHAFRGVMKAAAGDRAGARREFEKAKVAALDIGSDILTAPVNLGLMWGVNYISGIQRIIGAESDERPLTDGERAMLRKIFRESVNYDKVSIIEGRLGLLGATNSVFTICHRIRVADGSGFVPLSKHSHVLVHEMVHVWQFESGGPDYVGEALVAQATGTNGFWLDDAGQPQAAPPGYAFDVAVAAGQGWTDFNPEQQATFIEVAYQLGVDFNNPDASPMVFMNVDYTGILKNALEWIRAGEGAP